MNKENGGPAFPSVESVASTLYPGEKEHIGMTLRDYFAAHAPFTMKDAHWAFETAYIRHPNAFEIMVMLAEMRMQYADAMIEARQK